jgi:hypothetical protein
MAFIYILFPFSCYFYNIQFESGCSSERTPAEVFVNPLPVIVSKDTAICQGDQAVLNGGFNADSYLWSTGQTTPTLTTDTAGVYTITATLNGCSASEAIQVDVNALPVVLANASDSTLCDGDALTLFGSGADTYTWSNNVDDNVTFIRCDMIAEHQFVRHAIHNLVDIILLIDVIEHIDTNSVVNLIQSISEISTDNAIVVLTFRLRNIFHTCVSTSQKKFK